MQDLGTVLDAAPSQLPRDSNGRCGGRWKAKPEHFRVTELLKCTGGKRDGSGCSHVASEYGE